MKTTVPAIPAAISAEILSRHIDWSDKDRPQIAFQIQLSGPGGKEVFKYSGGILAFQPEGGVKLPMERNTLRLREAVQALRAGKRISFNPSDKGDIGAGAASWMLANAAPDLAGLLACLSMDASALDTDFEDWAAELGYNPDSRKDHALWEECRSQSRRYKKCVGEHFDTIAEALQDY